MNNLLLVLGFLSILTGSISSQAGIFNKVCDFLLGGAAGGIQERDESPDILAAEKRAKSYLGKQIEAEKNGYTIEWLKTELIKYNEDTTIRTFRVQLSVPQLRIQSEFDVTVSLLQRPPSIVSIQEVQ